MEESVPGHEATHNTNITLDQSAINAIAIALKETILSEVKVTLNTSIETIVCGVIDGLQNQISKVEQENSILKQENDILAPKVKSLEKSMDASEQYSRRNSLRISGIEESLEENTDSIVLDISNEIGSELSLPEIDRTQRVGKRKSNAIPRDIIVKFGTYRSRQKLYTNRSKLKVFPDRSAVFINEDLKKFRSQLLYNVRQLLKKRVVLGAWSFDGNVLIKVMEDHKSVIRQISTLEDLLIYNSSTVSAESEMN